jgi:hypothetical protein
VPLVSGYKNLTKANGFVLWDISSKNGGVIDLHSLNVNQALSVVQDHVNIWWFSGEQTRKKGELVSWEQSADKKDSRNRPQTATFADHHWSRQALGRTKANPASSGR